MIGFKIYIGKVQIPEKETSKSTVMQVCKKFSSSMSAALTLSVFKNKCADQCHE